MKREAWPIFSIVEVLRPPEGWRTDHAIIATYSADLTVIVTALFAMAGCDLDNRRTGSRIELIRAVDLLRDRFRVVVQKNRIAVPRASSQQTILKLLDQFVSIVDVDEAKLSWHPKVMLIRYTRKGDSSDFQWRLWLGSRNLTSASNWDAGITLNSRADGGRSIDGLATLARELAVRAALPKLKAAALATELEGQRWECPPGCDAAVIRLLGPGLPSINPCATEAVDKVMAFSPFLDLSTVRALAASGGSRAKRTLISTRHALQTLHQQDAGVFSGFENVSCFGDPERPAEGTGLVSEEETSSTETPDAEDTAIAGLHAKLFFTEKGAHRTLWIGSANATERAWNGRNYEAVARLTVPREVSASLEEFAQRAERFSPGPPLPDPDQNEALLHFARQSLSNSWHLNQKVSGSMIDISCDEPPATGDPAVKIEVAALGGQWTLWPAGAREVTISPDPQNPERSDFVQVRLVCGDKSCAWIQIAPCDPRPDAKRNRALVAHYLDASSFIQWLRSVLADETDHEGGGDWDGPDREPVGRPAGNPATPADILSVEEILRAWTRNPTVFNEVDAKVLDYIGDMLNVAIQRGRGADEKSLRSFQTLWEQIARELR